MDATADGILVVDREGRIVSYNLRFVDMWRLPEGVVLPATTIAPWNSCSTS